MHVVSTILLCPRYILEVWYVILGNQMCSIRSFFLSTSISCCYDHVFLMPWMYMQMNVSHRPVWYLSYHSHALLFTDDRHLPTVSLFTLIFFLTWLAYSQTINDHKHTEIHIQFVKPIHTKKCYDNYQTGPWVYLHVHPWHEECMVITTRDRCTKIPLIACSWFPRNTYQMSNIYLGLPIYIFEFPIYILDFQYISQTSNIQCISHVML